MPIKNLTDTARVGFPRVGVLRKGGEATRDDRGNVVKMGQDLSVFRFTSERPDVQAAFENAYGEQVALIDVYLPHAGVEANFDCWREKWAQGGLVHRCDGETMTIWLDKNGTYSRAPKPCDGGCKQIGRLSLILPELVKAGHVGYVTLQTSAINDIISIQSSLLAAAEARIDNELGLRGIRWSLRRIKEKVSTPMGNGKRARRDKWLVRLEPAADWVTLQLDIGRKANMLELPAPKNIDPETGEINPPELQNIDPPEDVEDAEFTEADVTVSETPGIAGTRRGQPAGLGQDPIIEATEEQSTLQANLADARAKVEAIVAKLGYSEQGFVKQFYKTYNTDYAAATLDQLTDAETRLTAVIEEAKAKTKAQEPF